MNRLTTRRNLNIKDMINKKGILGWMAVNCIEIDWQTVSNRIKVSSKAQNCGSPQSLEGKSSRYKLYVVKEMVLWWGIDVPKLWEEIRTYVFMKASTAGVLLHKRIIFRTEWPCFPTFRLRLLQTSSGDWMLSKLTSQLSVIDCVSSTRTKEANWGLTNSVSFHQIF